MKLDLSMFTPAEVEFITSPYPSLTGEPLPFYLWYRYYYYNIQTGQDEIVEFETSTTYFKYHSKTVLRSMKLRGFTLPYKFETQRIKDERRIAQIIDREKHWEF